MNRQDTTKIKNGGNDMKYKTDDINKCEYMDIMQKAYFDKPKQSNGKCVGYRNKYNGRISKECEKCRNWSDINDSE